LESWETKGLRDCRSWKGLYLMLMGLCGEFGQLLNFDFFSLFMKLRIGRVWWRMPWFIYMVEGDKFFLASAIQISLFFPAAFLDCLNCTVCIHSCCRSKLHSGRGRDLPSDSIKFTWLWRVCSHDELGQGRWNWW
jgi:hypothetical protein